VKGLLRDLLNRLDGRRSVAVFAYEVVDEPGVPAGTSATGQPRTVRPEHVEVQFVQRGNGPWRWQRLAIAGPLVERPGLRVAHTVLRRKDVPGWALPLLTPPDELTTAEAEA
jgi:hypothetical protein